MKDRFKKRYQEKEWKKKVDLSILFQLDELAREMHLLAKKRKEKEDREDGALQKYADRLTYLLAVANERVEVPTLKGERIQSPESEPSI